MSMILGIQQGWFGVAGLTCDLAGFVLLAWDLYPEYRLHRRADRIRRLTEGLAHVRAVPRAVATTDAEQIRAMTAAVLDKATLGDLNSVRRKFGLSSFRSNVDGPTLTTSGSEIEHAIEMERIRISFRSRPPVGWGIALVVVGSCLQIAGSWPRP